MSEDDLAVPVNCPVCETITRVSVAGVARAITTHNENQHASDEVIGIDPTIVDRIAALAAEESGLADE